MSFQVTIKTATNTYHRTAIGNRDDIMDSIYDEFDVCSISMMVRS